MNIFWCGKKCSDCEHPCKQDNETPCSLDCEGMNPDGTRNIDICKKVGCDAIIEEA